VIDKVLEGLQLAGEGTVGITHHTVKRDGNAWAIKPDTETVFLPKLKAPRVL